MTLAMKDGRRSGTARGLAADLDALMALRFRLRGAEPDDAARAICAAAIDLLDATAARFATTAEAGSVAVQVGSATRELCLTVPVLVHFERKGQVEIFGARRAADSSRYALLELMVGAFAELGSLPRWCRGSAQSASLVIATLRPGDLLLAVESEEGGASALSEAIVNGVRVGDEYAPMDAGFVVAIREPRAPALVVAERCLESFRATTGYDVRVGGAKHTPDVAPIDTANQARRMLDLARTDVRGRRSSAWIVE